MASVTQTHVRWMIRRDMTHVLDIERHNPETNFSEIDIIEHLKKRNTIGMVVEDDADNILGYMMYELAKSYLYIVTMAVHPDHRRTGVGSKMLNKLKGKLSPQRRSQLQWDVRESNLDAHLFLKTQGFKCYTPIKRDYFKDYYDDVDKPTKVEDAYPFVFTYQGSNEEF